mgnify:CR=1 FL=1
MICYFQKGCVNAKPQADEDGSVDEKVDDSTMGLSKVVYGVKDVVVGTTGTIAKESVNLLSHLAYQDGDKDKKYNECLYFVRPATKRQSEEPEVVNFRMNNQYALFWTEKDIWSIRIDDKF